MLKSSKSHLDPDALTVNGRTLGEKSPAPNAGTTMLSETRPIPSCRFRRGKTLAVLRGNLAPNGAVMKSSAANPRFLKHAGPAIVFDSPAAMNARSTIPTSTSRKTACWCCAMRVRSGAPGMPEWGNLPIPKKLLKQGVRDMVRICDGRMSGTHYGTCILHVAPEAAVGGPSACSRPATSWNWTLKLAASTCGLMWPN